KNALPLAGLEVPWPHFMVALLLLPLLVPRRDRRWSAVLRLPRPLGPMLLFWASCGLSVTSLALSPGSDPFQFLKTFGHLTIYVVFVCVVVKWITWPRLLLLVNAYYVLGIAAAMLSLLQMLHGGFGFFPWLAPILFQSAEYAVGEGLTTGFRASSFFGEPSWAARYYVHYLALALAFWVQTRRRRHLVALALFIVAFYGANSLLGYVILGTFLVAAAVAQMWRRNMFTLGRTQKMVLGGAAYVFLLLWLTGTTPKLPDLLDRSIARVGLVMRGGGGAGNRIDSVYAGLEVWKRAPVLGVGFGNIDRYIEPFYRDPAWVLRSQHASDSLYVQLVAETGIPGLLAFLWFWGRLLWFSTPRASLAGHPEAVEAYGWLRFLQLDLFAQAVGMINASDYMNPHLWTVVAIVLGCKVVVIRATRLDPTGIPAAGSYPVPVPNFAF
ncbi:MAG: O-antigen ligase family protein, partial [Acidobacteria bacterium]|nr:O-antigen ligase family protein [Acidobacteriota bacterium]